MGATKEHVKEQCRRFTALPVLASVNADGKREIADALLRNCQSDEHVTAVITKLLDGVEDPRNPIAAIARIAREIEQEVIEAQRAPMGCEDCRGTGWRRFTRLIQPSPDVEPYTADYSTFCGCQAGQWRKSKVGELEAK